VICVIVPMRVRVTDSTAVGAKAVTPIRAAA
jgi:hypothetical protein